MNNFAAFLLYLSLAILQGCNYNANWQIEHSKQKYAAATYNIQLGMAYLQQGDMPRAKRKLLSAIELAPDLADANSALAYYFERTGEIREARRYYHQALVLAPHSGAQLNNYGTFLCRLGKYSQAERYFLRSVRDMRYIYTAAAYENAGLCALAAANYPKARKYFTLALRQDPKRKRSLDELAQMELK